MNNHKLRQPRARVGWGGPSPSRSVHKALSRAVFEIVDMEAATVNASADVFVIDVRSVDKPVAVARERLVQSRRLGPISGILVYVSRNESSANRLGLAKMGEVVFENEDHTSLIFALRDRLRLGALAEETGERIKSLSGSAAVTAFPDLAAPTNSLSILIAGAPSPAALAAANTLSKNGFKTPSVFSAGHAMRTIEAEPIDGALFFPEDENDVLLALARALKRHRNFRKTPIIVCAPKLNVTKKWFQGEAFDLIYTEHLDTNLTAQIGRLTRRARLSSVMASFLAGCDGVNIRDRKSGAYAASFFSYHGARLHRRSLEAGYPLSMVGIGFSDDCEITRHERLLKDAVRTIKRITRSQDLVVRLSNNRLAILLPGATIIDAASIENRVLGVLSASLRTKSKLTGAVAAREDNLEETVASLIKNLQQSPAYDQNIQ